MKNILCGDERNYAREVDRQLLVLNGIQICRLCVVSIQLVVVERPH